MNLLPARTKIVATVGPACSEVKQLEALVRAGVDVFRLNMAHGNHESHGQMIRRIRKISDEFDRPLGVLVDLSGPKIRLGVLREDPTHCLEGQVWRFVRGSSISEPPATGNELTCTYDRLVDELDVGDRVMMADGAVSMLVAEKHDDRVACKVIASGVISSRQGVNLPGAKLSVPALTDKDREDVVWAAQQEIDFVSLSFVRRAEDLIELRELLRRHACEPWLVAKIEKGEALDDLDRIVQHADAVMVARGDLGIEIDVTQTPIAQKKIIRVSRKYGRPVIVATQMLDSMHRSPRPTRAETTDVANAILDGADACMLSGETAVGRFPTQAVDTMNRIMVATEALAAEDPQWMGASRTGLDQQAAVADGITWSVVEGAAMICDQIGAKLMVVATNSGATALVKCNQRDATPTLAISPSERILRRLSLCWGVHPLRGAPLDNPPAVRSYIEQWALRTGWVTQGDSIVFVSGTEITTAHSAVTVHQVG